MPKLVIRNFSGDITCWTTFWDSFESAIDRNTGLSDIDKFNYLKSLLEKSAAETISRLTLTADNYKKAIYILKKRFTKHMDILLNVEVVSSQYNIKGLRHLYDLFESLVRGLKSLDVELTSYGSLLLSVLLQKLPPDLHLILSRGIHEDDWNLDSLLRQLEEEIKTHERAMPPSTQPSTARKTGPRNDSTSTAAILLAPTNTPSCCLCHLSHPSSGCKTVLDIGERKNILMRSGRCFICLKKYHISMECCSAIRWRNCGGRHHTCFCMKNICPFYALSFCLPRVY